MGRFFVFLCCRAVVGLAIAGNSRNSRFGALNSRLGRREFPFEALRELPRKGLIGAIFSRPYGGSTWQNKKIPGSTGITGNLPRGFTGLQRELAGDEEQRCCEREAQHVIGHAHRHVAADDDAGQ